MCSGRFLFAAVIITNYLIGKDPTPQVEPV